MCQNRNLYVGFVELEAVLTASEAVLTSPESALDS
jgi:hypothetical protein